MAEPVSLADLKLHLRLGAGTAEDVMLTGMIVAARRACEAAINKSIVGASLTAALDFFPALSTDPEQPTSFEDLVIAIEGGQVVTAAITYVNADGAAQTVPPTAFTTDFTGIPARLAPVGAWPVAAERPGSVLIAYTVSPLGADDWAVVGQAMLMILRQWYDDGNPSSEVPPNADWLLRPLRQWATD